MRSHCTLRPTFCTIPFCCPHAVHGSSRAEHIPYAQPKLQHVKCGPQATQPSSGHDNGPSQSRETSPWPSHMLNDMSAPWTCPLAHQTPAEQPVSCPAPTPHPSDVAPCTVMCHYSVTHRRDWVCTEHVPRHVHQPGHVAWTPQPRSTTPGHILVSLTHISCPGRVGRRPDSI